MKNEEGVVGCGPVGCENKRRKKKKEEKKKFRISSSLSAIIAFSPHEKLSLEFVLAAAGSSLVLLVIARAASDCSWLSLAVPSCCWLLRAAPGCYSFLLTVLDSLGWSW